MKSSSNDRPLAPTDLDLEADLMDAFRSVRDEYDGTSPDTDTDLTLQRALFRTRKKTQKQRVTHWFLLPAAAVLIASTAFAGVTGHLHPAVRSVIETLHGSSKVPVPKSPEPPLAPTQAQSAIPDPEPIPAPTPEPESIAPAPTTAPTPTPAVAPPLRVDQPKKAPSVVSAPAVTSSSSPIIAPASVAVTPPIGTGDPSSSLFAEAHRLHFIDRDPARALVAWDRYLSSSPDPRFAPEARYNRALTLVRLSRIEEAKRELAPFASGTYGPYHREDAKALLARLNP